MEYSTVCGVSSVEYRGEVRSTVYGVPCAKYFLLSTEVKYRVWSAVRGVLCTEYRGEVPVWSAMCGVLGAEYQDEVLCMECRVWSTVCGVPW